MSETRNDEELMTAYCAGEAAAFDELYNRYRAQLFRFIRRAMGREDGVEELYQEVWSRLIEARFRYRRTAKFSTYLYTVAHNAAMDVNSGERVGEEALGVRSDLEPDDAAGAGDAATAVERPEVERQLEAGISRLAGDQRQAFLLKEEAGLSLPEIANVTGVNHETVRSRLRYAFAKLRRGLGAGSMTGPDLDDQDFDEYLGGDSELSSDYRRAAREQPSADIDRQIKRTAQDAVRRRTVLMRVARILPWERPLAWAAVLVLSVVLVILMFEPTDPALRMLESDEAAFEYPTTPTGRSVERRAAGGPAATKIVAPAPRPAEPSSRSELRIIKAHLDAGEVETARALLRDFRARNPAVPDQEILAALEITRERFDALVE